ncbi:expressed hypothetical protein, partial [Trichoplax adhaerens]
MAQDDAPPFEDNSSQRTDYISTEYLGIFCWLAVIVAAIGYYLWTNKLKPAISNRQKIQYHQNKAANAKKNDSSEALARNEKMLAARAKLQEDYNLNVQSYIEKRKQQDEIKRQNDILKLESKLLGNGRRLHDPDSKDKPDNSKAQNKRNANKTSWRDNYNPLTGGGAMSSYRPSRRSG